MTPSKIRTMIICSRRTERSVSIMFVKARPVLEITVNLFPSMRLPSPDDPFYQILSNYVMRIARVGRMRSRDGGSHARALERCRGARRWEAKAFAEKFVRTWLHPPSLCGLARASPSIAAVYPCCHCDALGDDRADGRDHHASCCRSQAGAPRATHGSGRPTRGRQADYGNRVDQDPAGDLLRRRRLDLPRTGIDRHDWTRDASRRLRRSGEEQGSPL